jgi:hypothetical protein
LENISEKIIDRKTGKILVKNYFFEKIDIRDKINLELIFEKYCDKNYKVNCEARESALGYNLEQTDV